MNLEAAGTNLDNVLTDTCYVTRSEDLKGFDKVYWEFFPSERTAIIVNFGAADNLVEVTSTACIPSQPGKYTKLCRARAGAIRRYSDCPWRGRLCIGVTSWQQEFLS